MKTEAQTDTDAPTQTGDSELFPATPAIAATITPTMIDSLRRSRQWVRLLCILGFITAGAMMLCGIVSQFACILVSMSPSLRHKPLLSASAMILIGLANMCLAIIYLIPALRLLELAAAIKKLPTQDGASGMEEALLHQRLFWRSAGIAGLGTIVVQAFVVGFTAAALRGLLRL